MLAVQTKISPLLSGAVSDLRLLAVLQLLKSTGEEREKREGDVGLPSADFALAVTDHVQVI